MKDTVKSSPSRSGWPLNMTIKPLAKLLQNMLPTKILSEKQGHSGSINPHNNDLPHGKMDLNTSMNITGVPEHKKNTQSSPMLPFTEW